MRQNGVEDARCDGEWLLARALGCGRMELHLLHDREVTPAKQMIFEGFIHRRARREPLQHILGTVTFGDLELMVDSRALIPRPETEELVVAIENYYAATATSPQSILDLGTGSGAIIFALGKIFPRASLTASDLDANALSLARANSKRCHMEKRITFCQSDWFQTVEGTWDLIVSNPPYLSAGEFESASPEVRLYEPRRALVAPNEGLEHLETIVRESPAFLSAEGLLALETGVTQHDHLIHVADRVGLVVRGRMHDLSGRPRMLLLQRCESQT
ncbi:MAG: peptide chain release factor N(5)-glutamine methyltransferase [Puniceicoccales bacterium]|nr:peptide chain release factor N(5)-glutamine methyltransferase [Puniceicoccales bacterium]